MKMYREKVEKQLVIDMDKDYNKLEAPVVPHIKATQDRVVLEIQRGCIRGCRFCQAGMIYRPTRERDIETLKESARIMLQKTGHEEISLSSLSSSDYSHLKEIVNFLIDEFRDEAVNISLPSLRIDAFALDVMSKVQDVKKAASLLLRKQVLSVFVMLLIKDLRKKISCTAPVKLSRADGIRLSFISCLDFLLKQKMI